MTLTAIMAHMVCLAPGFYICVHAWCGWDVTAMEVSWWYFMVDWVVMSWEWFNRALIYKIFLLTSGKLPPRCLRYDTMVTVVYNKICYWKKRMSYLEPLEFYVNLVLFLFHDDAVQSTELVQLDDTTIQMSIKMYEFQLN